MKLELGVLESNKEQGELRLTYKEVRLDEVKYSANLSMDDVLGRFCLGGNWTGAVSGRVKLQSETADGPFTQFSLGSVPF